LYPLREVDARAETQVSSRSPLQESSLPGLMDMDSARESQVHTSESKTECRSPKHNLNLLLNDDVGEDSVRMTSPCPLGHPGEQPSQESNIAGHIQLSVDEYQAVDELRNVSVPGEFKGSAVPHETKASHSIAMSSEQSAHELCHGVLASQHSPKVGADSAHSEDSRNFLSDGHRHGLEENDLHMGGESDPPQPQSSSNHAPELSLSNGQALLENSALLASLGSCHAKVPLAQDSNCSQIESVCADPAEDLMNQEHAINAVEGEYCVATPVIGDADANANAKFDTTTQRETVKTSTVAIRDAPDAEKHSSHGREGALGFDVYGSKHDRRDANVPRCSSTAKPEPHRIQAHILGATDTVGPTSNDSRNDSGTMLLSHNSDGDEEAKISSTGPPGPHVTQAPAELLHHAKEDLTAGIMVDISASEVRSADIQDIVEVGNSQESRRHTLFVTEGSMRMPECFDDADNVGDAVDTRMEHEVRGAPAMRYTDALEFERGNHADEIEDAVENVIASLFEYALESLSEFEKEGASQASVSMLPKISPREGSRHQTSGGYSGIDWIKDRGEQSADSNESTLSQNADHMSMVHLKLECDVDEVLRDLLDSAELVQDTGTSL